MLSTLQFDAGLIENFPRDCEEKKSYIPETRGNPNCSPRSTTLLICEAVEGGLTRMRGHRKRKTHAKLAHLKSFASSSRAFEFRDFCNMRRYTSCIRCYSLQLFKLIFKGRTTRSDRRSDPSTISFIFFPPFFFHAFSKSFVKIACEEPNVALRSARAEDVLGPRHHPSRPPKIYLLFEPEFIKAITEVNGFKLL